MEVFFGDKKLGKICNDEKSCRRKFGRRADIVMLRLSQLDGAENLAIFNVPPLKQLTDFHALHGNRHGQYSISTGNPYRLILTPMGAKAVLTEVMQVKIVEIIDYH